MNFRQRFKAQGRTYRACWVQALVSAMLAAPLLLLLTSDSRAQSSQDDASGWKFVCAKPPAVADDECAIVKSVVAANRPQAGMTIAVIRKPGISGYTVRIVAPLGVLLTKKLSVRLDEQDFGQLGYLRCFSNGCIAQTQDAAFVDQIKSSSILRLAIFETPDDGIMFPISLSGLASSLLKSLPVE